ncbi:uncharacterized protein JN550_008142 [Neoarthrinium moseri]|uniref:uncharacterized protein n=1 Tax=Neoarthrinium moseri TaxID=1658444 RepID=UPI001FDC3D9D|nr:uncharacterized protein JN550_008142 [Neoarthrinium moseri]KAI1865884.1 hypothetical protein JN550_008142 [Neoarthrinium moseri]
MAGSVSDFSLPNSSFFNIYNDGRPVTRSSPAPSLPGGQCNFVDLAHGANGPKCGCRRFWSRAALGFHGNPSGPSGYSNGSPTDQAAFCMCSHHACYHDDVHNTPGPIAAPAPVVINPGQENERPRSNREPLTPVMPGLSFQMPAPSDPPQDFHTFNNTSLPTDLNQDGLIPAGEKPGPPPEASIPDTLSWGNLIQSQPGHRTDVLPPIPSQCLLPPSQPSSTTSSARIAYLKPFGGTGLNTLRDARSKLRDALPVEPDDGQDQNDEMVDHSVDPSVDDLQTVTNTPRSTRRTDVTDKYSQGGSLGPNRQDFQELSNTVQSHEHRLDRLETVSFDHDHEDCHDQHDRTDLRVTELEVRVEELEKTLSDGSSVATSQHRSRRPGVDESTASIASISTSASGRADRAEMQSELLSLKAQLSYLQASSFPCYAHPWEVEVVFFPFPLKGVWYESREFPSQRQSGGTNVDTDQWTQLPNSSSTTTEPQSPGFSEWAGPELESEWLLPRACPPGKTIDQRLRSRGLVKTVTVRGPDARSVQQAISAAFGTVFRTFSRMQANVYHGSTTHHRVSKFFGLQQPWVPLRKIHKDSRLRFLTPAEMVTPASWDVPFLSNSVVMKATGAHRLFITQPEAYLQDQDAYDNGWSWQRLRELSRVYPDSQSSQQDVPEADAMEDYWTWNDSLDEQTPSQNSALSLSLRQAAQPRLRSITPSQAQVFASRSGLSASLTTSRSRAASPMILKERKSSIPRPIYVRTTSMPPVLPPMASPSQAKRRIATATFGNIRPFPYERRSSPQVLRASTGSARVLMKESRRRATRSPSAPLSARLRNTPRWSTHSASPMPEPFAIIGPPSDAEAACRQTTPFYYATPYSNAPFVEPRPSRGVIDPDDDHGSGTDYSYKESVDDSEDEDYDAPMLDLGHPRPIYESGEEDCQAAQHPLPEDEIWPGIEDEENRNPEDLALDSVGIYVDDDAMSDILDADGSNHLLEGDSQNSSAPSEYPITQSAWVDDPKEFKVYEDAGGMKH